jgi:hypothetical protein
LREFSYQGFFVLLRPKRLRRVERERNHRIGAQRLDVVPLLYVNVHLLNSKDGCLFRVVVLLEFGFH